MQTMASYDEGAVVAVRRELAERVAAARAAGIPDERLVLDPGLGFAKTAEHNWALLAGLGEIAGLGFPLLVGASRKSFLGALLRDAEGAPRPVDDREAAGAAVTVLLAQQGVWGIRVHDVRASRDALKVWARLEEERWTS
jgi:dihydropteroate synthase